MTKRWAGAVALLVVLAGCSGHPPNTAVPEDEAAHKPGTLQQTTPLAAIIKARDIRPLDPRAPQGLLPQLERELAKTDPQGRYRGITYTLSNGNALERDWIVQTPDLWGQKAGIATGDQSLPGRLRTLIASARQTVDIAALQPAPDGAFLDAMRDGIASLARSGRAVKVRLLVGTYPLGTPVDAKALLLQVAQKAKSIPGSRLKLYVAAMRSCLGDEDCDSFTWNHAKFVAVDGKALFAGGHNFWARDYLGREPVHDLSLFLRGPAAGAASGFTDALWGFVCQRSVRGGPGSVQAVGLRPDGEIGDDCLAQLAAPKAAPAGKLRVLSVARLGAGITKDFANQSDLARDLMLGAAEKSIFIAQQDFGFTLGRPDVLWPESTLERLADFLLADKGELYIVLSNPNAKSLSGESYSNGVALESVAKKIHDVARARNKAIDEAGLNRLLCRRLHLAPLRFGPDASWPENRPIGNHAKFYMVDERAFYVGSDNFYPVNLQEFGNLIEDPAAAREIRRAYWDKLWRWSSAAAISGGEASSCTFGAQAASR